MMRRGEEERGRRGYFRKVFSILILFFLPLICSAQVKIRLFADKKPESVIFTVTSGEYELEPFTGEKLRLKAGEPVIISELYGKLALKPRNMPGILADSIHLSGTTGEDSFSLMINTDEHLRQYYTGDLRFIPDLETIVLINLCQEEEYIAGVTQAEGGNGQYGEYFKTQAVIARTYMYRNMARHTSDGYNLCDNTHCQVYSGTATNQVIRTAASDTRGLVILDRDSVLIIPAFHSNCGGETSPAEFVWLSPVPYLRRIKDPYCAGRGNSTWQKTIPGDLWVKVIHETDHEGRTINIKNAGFVQNRRTDEYKADKLSVPFREIRTALDLRSAFFSVQPHGNNIVLTGRGYGHGVGLCQEGAMTMALKGFDFRKIIGFYYPGVIISDIAGSVVPYDGLIK